MANGRRDAAKERRWRELVSRQASSGLPVREFCKREGLSEATFYAWRRTIAERDGEPPQATAFVPLVVSDQPKSDASIAIELAGGRVLKLSASISAAWVAEFAFALEARAER